MAIFDARNKGSTKDAIFKADMISVKMMNELLKNEVCEVKNDISALFRQNYNFQDRQERKPQWMNEPAAASGPEKEKEIKLESGMTEPWGIYMKAVPDSTNMFSLNDLPQETFEPPTTPRGIMREKINYLTIDF